MVLGEKQENNCVNQKQISQTKLMNIRWDIMENVKLLLGCGMSGRSVKMPKTASAPFRSLPTSHTLIMKVNSRMTNKINKHSLVTIMVITTSVASFLVLGGGGARPPNVPTEKVTYNYVSRASASETIFSVSKYICTYTQCSSLCITVTCMA